jgi:hypothetical protein
VRIGPFLAAALALSLAAPAIADEAADHLQGEPAATAGQALANFLCCNKQIREARALETPEEMDLEDIHECTYTIEIALAGLYEDSAAMAVTLEELHLATESCNADAVGGIAADSLKTADTLGRQAAGLDGAGGAALVRVARGELAEWLRTGLQIREGRFDSGTRLHPLPGGSPQSSRHPASATSSNLAKHSSGRTGWRIASRRPG